jgi:hypothetical protein
MASFPQLYLIIATTSLPLHLYQTLSPSVPSSNFRLLAELGNELLILLQSFRI